MAKAVKVARLPADRSQVKGEQESLFDIEDLELALARGGNGDRKSYARIPDVLPVPSLIDIQLQSFRWFQEKGLRELFEEIFPIESLNGKMRLELVKYWFEDPKHSEQECRVYDMTYASPLYIRARLVSESGERLDQDVYLGDFPLMTQNGTFVINGAERVVVSQLIRSSGIYFRIEEDRPSGRMLCSAKLIPNRGAWLEFETSKADVLSVKVDRKRKLPITLLLRSLAALELAGDPHRNLLTTGGDDELLRIFQGSDSMPDHSYIASTIEKDLTKDARAAVIEFFKKMRPGDPATLENA